MMNRSKMPLTFSLTPWNKKTRIILPCVNIRNISSLPEKTAKLILISCASRLAPFDIKEVREITMYDELDLDMLEMNGLLFSLL